MEFYIDASVPVPRLISEPATAAVERYLNGLADGMVIGEFAAAEVASAVSRLMRTGLINASDGLATLADFDRWRSAKAIALDVEGADVRLATVYVRRFDLMLRAPTHSTPRYAAGSA